MNQAASQDVNNQNSIFSPPPVPRPCKVSAPEGYSAAGHPSVGGGGRRPQLPNSWVPRLPGVTQQLPPGLCGPKLRVGQEPAGARDQAWAILHDARPAPSAFPALCFRSPPSPTPVSPRVLLSLSAATSLRDRRSDGSAHTRTERACSSYFPEFTAGPRRAGTRGSAGHSLGQSPAASAQPACALPQVRARPALRPAPAPIAFSQRPRLHNVVPPTA